MTTVLSRAGPPDSGAVFFAGLVSALSIGAGSYASLILWGNRLSTAPAMRMAMIYTGLVTVAGGILAGLWGAAHGQNLRLGPVDILIALPWLVLYGAGFYAVAASTVNPLLSAEGRRNVTEQADLRMHDQVTEPHSQGVFLAAIGVVVALFVLMIGLVAATNPGGGVAPPGVNAAVDPGGKDPNATDPNAQDPNYPPPDPPPYEPPPQDNYDANPPVEQQSDDSRGQ